MWFAVIFFSIVAICAVGSIWESRRRRALYSGRRTATPGDAGSFGHNSGSVYGHGGWHGGYGDAGAGSFSDCGGSGGGGGDSGGGC